jgi:hypothetical protein
MQSCFGDTPAQVILFNEPCAHISQYLLPFSRLTFCSVIRNTTSRKTNCIMSDQDDNDTNDMEVPTSTLYMCPHCKLFFWFGKSSLSWMFIQQYTINPENNAPPLRTLDISSVARKPEERTKRQETDIR